MSSSAFPLHRRTGAALRSQPGLPLTPPPAVVELAVTKSGGPRAIEDESFPFEALSDIAEIESWRKEISRPLTHIHKWWAQRLGTVFRAIVLATFAPSGSDILKLFYAPTRVPEAVVFDPFMGSGTTVIEALKLGARAIGRDINPVAWFMVKTALARHDRAAILEAFAALERDVAADLRRYYRTTLADGTQAEVLYYFWVKTLACPACTKPVDLFGSYIFAQHAYPKLHPESQAICPHCGGVNETRYDAEKVACGNCHRSFDPRSGPAKGTKARCGCCSHEFPIAKTIRASGHVPQHRLYAKLVLLPSGQKVYLSTTEEDRKLYAQAERELAKRKNAYPVVAISPGYNTDQALGYNYRFWHEMFNARQLLALSILGERIARIDDPAVRELFLCLLSGTLEFNNMFASYKGEGTGAVRHMFYHHILKPERVPLEANLWGTPRSSGSFSTLFESRILRALDYADDPFEIQLIDKKGKKSSEKVYGLASALGYSIATDATEFEGGEKVYLSCGDSSTTDIPPGSVDAVISDPPFFDNVHYSQLADFFHVWQRHFLRANDPSRGSTTRSEDEVQNGDAATFTNRLGAVWTECRRVLKDDGLLVFTYHHSRPEGWSSVLQAIMDAGFMVVAAHPIKAEMSVATPKHQAKDPIDLDIVLVCRKRASVPQRSHAKLRWENVLELAENQIARLRAADRWLSRNDIRIIVMAQLMRALSQSGNTKSGLAELEACAASVETAIARLAVWEAGKPCQKARA
jgi:putative DNA methylase